MATNGSNGHRGPLRLYRSYVFRKKDPSIDAVRTIIQDEGLKIKHVAVLSGVSPATIDNWLHGTTMHPRFSTIAAVGCGLGYATINLRDGHPQFKKTKEIDYERERDKAANEILALREKMKRREKRQQRRVRA